MLNNVAPIEQMLSRFGEQRFASSREFGAWQKAKVEQCESPAINIPSAVG